MNVSTTSADLRGPGAVDPCSEPPRRPAGAISDVVVRNTFPFALVAVLALVLSAIGPVLLVPDSWMTLVAGREVWESGIPRTESLTVLADGERWIDQQWLGQLLFFAVYRLGGLSAVTSLQVLAATLSLGLAVTTARMLGASARSTFLVGAVSMFVAPWSWQVRGQGLALPLFAATLLLAATYVRRPSGRLFLALPVLVVWANVHGSVVLGAAIVSIAVVGTAIGSRRSTTGRRWEIALLPLSWLAAAATPYGTEIVAYYRLMLVDPPFAGLVVEWQRTRPTVITAAFFVVAVATVALVIRNRRRFTWFELVVLALTLVGALQALRGVVWFALVATAFLPIAVDGLFRRRDVIAPRRANLALVALVGGVALVAFVANLARPDSAFERAWPVASLSEIRDTPPQSRVFAGDRHTDWLLWHVPELRGRIAFDVRYELYTREEIEALARYESEVGDDWLAITDGYDVVVLDERDDPSHLDDLLAEPGTTVVYRDEDVVVVRRAPPSRGP